MPDGYKDHNKNAITERGVIVRLHLNGVPTVLPFPLARLTGRGSLPRKTVTTTFFAEVTAHKNW